MCKAKQGAVQEDLQKWSMGGPVVCSRRVPTPPGGKRRVVRVHCAENDCVSVLVFDDDAPVAYGCYGGNAALIRDDARFIAWARGTLHAQECYSGTYKAAPEVDCPPPVLSGIGDLTTQQLA